MEEKEFLDGLGSTVISFLWFIIIFKSMEWTENNYSINHESKIPGFIRYTIGILMFLILGWVINRIFDFSYGGSMILMLVITWPSFFIYNEMAVKFRWKINKNFSKTK